MQSNDQSKQFAKTIQRMTEISPGQGLSHALIHCFLLVGLGGATTVFWQHDVRLAVVLTIPLALIYTAVLVTTHDCVHSTYTGIKTFDDQWPKFWSWMIYWPYCTYKELHLLHHSMLGIDYADPERSTFLKSEFEGSSRLKRWYIRHQWLVNIFIFGGIGYALRHWILATQLRQKYPQLQSAMRKDRKGILCFAGIQFLLILYFNVFGEFLICYFVLERIAGGLMQMRSLAEHYGLWEGRHGNPDIRNALSSRNVKAGWFARWLFNDLCFHSIHHVYPQIPWYKLGEAHLTLPAFWHGVTSRMIEPKNSYGKIMLDGVRSWRLLQ